MTGTKKSLLLVGDNTSAAMAEELAKCESFMKIPASIGLFGSNEPFVELYHNEKPNYQKNLAALQGASVTIVQSTGGDVSNHCFHLLQSIGTLKNQGVKEITVLMPFTAFDRQDRIFPERMVSKGAETFAGLLKKAGADKIIGITPHSQAAMQFYKDEFGEHNCTALSTTAMFAKDIKKRFSGDLDTVMVGAPDGADKPQDEGQARARDLTGQLFEGSDEELAKKRFHITKAHTGINDTKILDFTGSVEGKDCIIIDDMIDRGGTMINAAMLLKSRGARSVCCYATHPIFAGAVLEKMLTAKHDGMNYAIDKLIVTDTIPDVHMKLAEFAKQKPKLADRVSVLTVAPLISQEIERQNALEPLFATRIIPSSGRSPSI